MARRNNRIKKGYIANDTVELIMGGTAYFKLLISLINQAQKSIHLQVYILQDDETGGMVTAALMDAVKRKVEVYLLVDGYASQALPDKFVSELVEAGIHFRFFEPFLKSRNFYFGRRMHHKLVVVDAMYALTGGMNIANRYNDINGIPAWLDFALYVKGDTAKELCQLCKNEWRGYANNPPAVICEQPAGNDSRPDESLLVKICRNDWVRRKNHISGMYIEMLRSAKSHVTILSSYFLPGRIIRRQIVQAVKNGVKVKVITAGISDIKIAKNAERWLYDYLLRNNVELYEYQDNVLHGKIAACDGSWMTAGSYNINDISAYASIELNLAVKNAQIAQHTESVLQSIISDHCIPITKEQHARSKNIFNQFARWFSFQFIRIVFYLFTFYFKQRG